MKLSLFKNLRAKKMLYNNFISFTALALLPMIFSTIWFINYTDNVLNNEMASINLNALNRARDMFDSAMHQTDMLAVNTSLLSHVSTFMASDTDEETVYTIQGYLKQHVRISEYIDSIYISSNNSDYIITDNDYLLKNDLDDIRHFDFINSTSDKAHISAYKRMNIYPYIISFVRNVKVVDIYMGSVAVNVNLERLGNVFKDTENRDVQDVYLFDCNNINVYSTKISETFGRPASEFEGISDIIESGSETMRLEVNGVPCLISLVKSKYFDITYVGVAPLEASNSKLMDFWKYVTIILPTAFLIGLLTVYLITIRSVNPIEKILFAIEEPSKIGVFKNENVSSEIKYIINNIKQVHMDNERLESELNSRLFLLRQSQLTALYSQINPHFLYNTLDAINWMAFTKFGAENEISKSIEWLSKMFRIGLETESYIVSLDEELMYAQMYCKLLKLRHNGKININFSIKDNIGDSDVIKFCIQPLIENAVNHGIIPTRKKGEVNISAYAQEDVLVIKVSDNGRGMSEKQIYEMNSALKKGLDNVDYDIHKLVKGWRNQGRIHGTGLGVYNVNQRIMLIFGEAYGVTLELNETGGLTALVKMPISKSKKK